MPLNFITLTTANRSSCASDAFGIVVSRK